MSDVSNTDSITLSKLHNTYCMSINVSQTWQYTDPKNVEQHCMETIIRILDIDERTHNILLN